MTAVRGNASVYQGYPVSRIPITGEGRAEFSRAWGHAFEQEGAGGGGGGLGGATQNVRGNYKSFKGIHLTDLEGMHQCIIIKNENTLQLTVRSNILSNSSLQAVCDTPIARITGCVPSLGI